MLPHSLPQWINRPLPKKSLPIGVFDPPFNKLSTDEMLDKFVSLGIEAVEVGAAGPTGRRTVHARSW